MAPDSIAMYVTVGVVMAFAATVASLMGFGFNLMAAPLLVIWLDATDVVPAIHLAYLPLGFALIYHRRHDMNPKRVGAWTLVALPGLLLGIWILGEADKDLLKRMIGTVTILSTLLIISLKPRPLRRERLWWTGACGLSGVLGGSTGLSGPPVVLMGLFLRCDPPKLRADMLTYFCILSVIVAPLYWTKGILTESGFHYALAGLPGTIIGFFIGNWATRHLTDHRFRTAAAVLMIIAGVMPWFA